MSDHRQAVLDAACHFLLQSPPGEVNDVLADLRAILSPAGLSPSEIEAGLAPALRQYHETQFTPVPTQGGGLITLVSKVGNEDQYLEPNRGKVFRFDHSTGKTAPATTDYTSPFSAETESARSALNNLLSTHVANHYTDGVAAVYILPDPAFPPEGSEPESSVTPAPAPVPEAIEHEITRGSTAATVADQALAEDVQGSGPEVANTAAETAQVVNQVLENETVETANDEQEVAAAEEEGTAADAPSGEVAEGTEAGAPSQETTLEPGETGTATQEAATEEEAGLDKMDIASPAPAPSTDETIDVNEPSKTSTETGPLKLRPSNRFGLYFVGHKYSPNNYWTGRWRSTYSLDLATGTLEGTAQVNIHYYEQGNVQLSTTFKSTSSLGATPSPEAVVASIKSSESAFQRQVGETYGELSDASFRGLRRALPKTRSKLDWDRAVGYKLGRELGGQAA
ncbi:hypothetical protein JCM3774_005709 [Rhodotorula dairenensis]